MSAKPYQPPISSDDGDEEYTAVPVIPVDSRYHTDAHPECVELACDYEQERIADLIEAYQDGLVSAEDMTRIASGQTV